MKLVPGSHTVKTALSGHAAIGLLAGAMLYLVCLSGTVLTFYDELQRIEQAGAPEMTAITPQGVQRGLQAVADSEKGKPATTHLYIHLPTPDMPRATVTTDSQAVHLNTQGGIAAPEENHWSKFLYALHYSLHIPGLAGFAIVGALGVLMLALSISGVLAHPKIFRDAFRFRTRHGGGVGLSDWHNRLSVWTLPFGIAIALTGAVIGLGSVAGFAVASKYYGGDLEALYASVFGKEAKPDKAAAPLPDVTTPLAYMAANYPDVRVSYVILHDPGTRGQHVQIVGEHPRRLIFGEYYAFDAAGRFHGKAGLSDGAIGQQAAASNYNLHFGNYGGLPVKLAYCLFGLALTIVSGTGVYIWLGKRQRRGIHEPRLRAAWDGVVWGSPAVLALTFAARFVLGDKGPFVAIFWIALAAVIAGLIVRAGRAARLQAA